MELSPSQLGQKQRQCRKLNAALTRAARFINHGFQGAGIPWRMTSKRDRRYMVHFRQARKWQAKAERSGPIDWVPMAMIIGPIVETPHTEPDYQ